MRAPKSYAWAVLGVWTLLAGTSWGSPSGIDALISQGALVSRSPSTGLVSFVGVPVPDTRLAPASATATGPAGNARAHLNRFAPDFGIQNPDRDASFQRIRTNDRGSATRFQQTVSGVPVIGGELIVSTDPAGALRAIIGKATDLVVVTTPKIPESAASDQALALVAKKYSFPPQTRLQAASAGLWIYDPRLLANDRRPGGLVWRFVVTAQERLDIDEFVLVHAETGAIALNFSQVHTARNRLTYDAAFGSNLPGTLQCTEGNDACTSGAILDADNAHRLAANVYDFFASRFGRDGIEGSGNPIVSTVRYCQVGSPCPYTNAFFTSSGQQMVYGQGLVVDDVAAHEFTHGVTRAESNLFYFGEAGAINESLSDVFGEFVDLTNGEGNDSPAVRWLMGEDSSIGAIRSMKDPPAYGDPDRKLSPNWYTGPSDGGGVHTNSGVGNKAAYLIVDGDTFNGRTIQGIGIDKAAQIYYEAQTGLLTSGSNYLDLYNALFQACVNLTGYQGITSNDCTQVREATLAVQMNLTAAASSAVAFCPAGSGYSEVGWDDFEGGGTGVGTLSRIGVGTQWFLDSSTRTSGTYSAIGVSQPFTTDSSLTYQLAGTVTAGDRLYFNHALDTEFRFDGGVVEYSLNGGAFVDAGPLLFDGQGYNSTILSGTGSPIGGRAAFTGYSGGFFYTGYNLAPLAGKSVRWRFRSTSDSSFAYYGWNIDDISHLRCNAGGIQFTAAADTVNESSGTVVVTVNRSGGASGAATVAYATSNGTALAGVDYVAKSGTLSWAAGDAHPKTVVVSLMNRAGNQGNRNFNVSLSSATGGALGSPTVTSITIADNDGSFQLEESSVSVGESGPNTLLTVTRTGFAGAAASVTWSTTAQTATAGLDFTTRSGTLSWIAGDSSPRTIAIGPNAVGGAYIPILDDALVEGPETFTVNLSSPTGGILGAQRSATVTILSDDRGVTMATGARQIVEGAGSIQVEVQRSGPATGSVSVDFSTVNGTALAGSHYEATNGTLTWPDGDSSPQFISVPLIDNSIVNASRAFSVALSNAVGATVGSPGATTVTLLDDDNTLQFTVAAATVAEGAANLSLTVSRVGGAGAGASVNWATADGSALAGADFGIAGNPSAYTGTLTWAAGDATSKTLTVPILNDAVVEGAKNFSVALVSPAGATLGAVPSVTVTLNDNDAGLRFSSATYEVTEGVNPSVVLTVQRIGPATMAATATWATVNVTATSGQDFGVAGTFAPRTGTLSWIAGDATTKTITIPIINDLVGGEGDETFTVVLTPGAGLVLGTPGIATVTIHDDDIPPETTVQFSAPKYTVMENGGSASLTVTRTDLGGALSTLAASVKFSTVAGSALATSDYTTVTLGTLNWASGDFGSKTISIPIVNNAIAEPPEFFKVILIQPNPGTGIGAPGEATVWIFDDDEAFPLDGVMPAGFSIAPSVTTGWHVSNDPGAYEGAYTLKNDEIDDNESAGIEMAGTFAAGNVTFRVKVSTEATFDRLEFYLDGVLQTAWSGTAVPGWQLSPTYSLAAGAHTLSWMYIKDGSVSVGMDAVYIDALITPAFTP